MRILSLDLDVKHLGMAYIGGTHVSGVPFEDFWQQKFVVADFWQRIKEIRDHIRHHEHYFPADLVVLEELIPSFQTKFGTVQKAQLHAVVTLSFMDAQKPIVHLPAIWLRSYLSEKRYKGKEANLAVGREWGLPDRLLEQNERSKQEFKPLVYEHALDAMLWAKMVQQCFAWRDGKIGLPNFREKIARKILEKIDGDGSRSSD